MKNLIQKRLVRHKQEESSSCGHDYKGQFLIFHGTSFYNHGRKAIVEDYNGIVHVCNIDCLEEVE